MAAPQPQLKVEELQERVRSFIRSVTHVNARNLMEFRRLVREAKDLAKTDVVAANCIEAVLQGTLGDDAEAERLFANAEANQGGAPVVQARISYLVNRMNFASAYQLGRELMASREGVPFHVLARSMLVAGAFQLIKNAIDRSQANSEVLHLTEEVNKARAAAVVLEKLQIADEHCVAVLDALGEVIRDRGLVWLNEVPEVSVLSDVDGESAVIMGFRFSVTPAMAAELAWEFTERLVDRNLDLPGFYVQVISQEVGVHQVEPA